MIGNRNRSSAIDLEKHRTPLQCSKYTFNGSMFHLLFGVFFAQPFLVRPTPSWRATRCRSPSAARWPLWSSSSSWPTSSDGGRLANADTRASRDQPKNQPISSALQRLYTNTPSLSRLTSFPPPSFIGVFLSPCSIYGDWPWWKSSSTRESLPILKCLNRHSTISLCLNFTGSCCLGRPIPPKTLENGQ